MQDGADKLVIRKSNWVDSLREYLSRKEPLQQCEFVIKCRLDEDADEIATFSIDSIKVVPQEGDHVEEKKEQDETESVMEWAKESMKDTSPASSY